MAMYSIPELFGATDKLVHVDPLAVGVCEGECIIVDNGVLLRRDLDLQELLEILMEENNLRPAKSVVEAVDLYVNLRRILFTAITNWKYHLSLYECNIYN